MRAGDLELEVGRVLAVQLAEELLPRSAAVRRRDTRIAKPSAGTVLQQGDVLVLLGAPADLAAAEMRLTQGG